MDAQTRNLLAAAVAGVIIGAGATAALMYKSAPPTNAVDLERPGPGVNPDDVVAVLDADPGPSPRSRDTAVPARSSDAAPAGAVAPVDPSVPTLSADRSGENLDELRGRRLVVPVEGIDRSKLVQSFDDQRSGSRRHEAIDILAPRNTPVVAVDDGTAARLFMSRAGGITLYQYDPKERFVYYYAHLERYADGLKEGDKVRRGQVIGYVGTTGNAPPNTPHLHFAIFEMSDKRRWWEGRPLDPFLVLR